MITMGARPTLRDAPARRLGIKREYISALVRVTYLAPDIVSALVAGRHPEGLSPARIIAACKDLSPEFDLTITGFEISEIDRIIQDHDDETETDAQPSV